MHSRFKREVWATKSDFTGSLAKWLVKQSPYIVPDKLSECVIKFNENLHKIASFDTAGMAKIDLSKLTNTVNGILESIPEIMALNERKDGKEGWWFISRFDDEPDPDSIFIDIMAVAQNITCDFADDADAQCWLDHNKKQESEGKENN